MSVQSEITRINGNIADAYGAVDGKGGTLPSVQNSANLASAIASIPSGITPSGNIQLTQQSGTNVTNYATASVRNGSLSLNTPTINTSTGVVTASASLSTSGWVGSAPSSTTLSLTTQGAKTVTPGTSSQTAVAAGKYTTGAVTVAAVPSEDKTVSLSMASGDQTVNASSDKWMTSVTVSKPETLLPENIKENINIAGVIGTYVGGSWPPATITPGDTPVLGTFEKHSYNSTSTLTASGVTLTVPKSGTYRVRWMVYCEYSNKTMQSRIYKNGTAYGDTHSFSASGSTGVNTSKIESEDLTLSAGDTIEIYIKGVSSLGTWGGCGELMLCINGDNGFGG